MPRTPKTAEAPAVPSFLAPLPPLDKFNSDQSLALLTTRLDEWATEYTEAATALRDLAKMLVWGNPSYVGSKALGAAIIRMEV